MARLGHPAAMPAAASFGMLAVASILFHYASILSHPHKCRPVVIACSYHGEPLEEPMAQLAVNALQYYLSQGEVEKEWSESY